MKTDGLSNSLSTRKAFRIASRVVDATSAVNDLELALEKENLRPGRPREMSTAQFFKLLLTMALTDRALFIEHIPTMVEDLHWGDRRVLGLDSITSNQAEYLFGRIERNLQLQTDLGANVTGKVTTLNESLDELLNSFVATTDSVRSDYPRGAAIDGTRVRSRYQGHWETVEGSPRMRFTDPDVTLHAMPKVDSHGNKEYRDVVGYCITTIVNTPALPGDNSTVPMTTSAIAVSDAVMGYTKEHVVAEPLVRRIGSRESISMLVGDNGYYHHPRFPDVVRRAGIEPIMPLPQNKKGPRGNYQGVIAAADAIVCPATPEQFLDLRGLSGQSLVDVVEKRRPFELAQHGKRRPDGSCRYSCPALRGRVRCLKRPESMRLSLDRPTVLNPPTDDPSVCVQRTITLPAEFLTYVQEYKIGTAMNTAFMGLRQRVESTYAQLKSRRSGGLSGDMVAVRGLVKTSILYAIVVAAENAMRLIGVLRKARIGLADASDHFDWLDTNSPVLRALVESATSPRGDP